MDPQQTSLSSELASSSRTQSRQAKDRASCPNQGQGQGKEIDPIYGSEFEQIDEGVSLLDDDNEPQSQKLAGEYLVFAAVCCNHDLEEVMLLHVNVDKMQFLPFCLQKSNNNIPASAYPSRLKIPIPLM